MNTFLLTLSNVLYTLHYLGSDLSALCASYHSAIITISILTAMAMVTKLGMSKEVGLHQIDEKDLANGLISDTTKHKIETDVNKF